MARTPKALKDRLVDVLVDRLHDQMRIENLRDRLESALQTYISKYDLQDTRVFSRRRGAHDALESFIEFARAAGIKNKLLEPVIEIVCALDDADNGVQSALTNPKKNRHNDPQRHESAGNIISKKSYEARAMARALAAYHVLQSRGLKPKEAREKISLAAVGASGRLKFEKKLQNAVKKLKYGDTSPLTKDYFCDALRSAHQIKTTPGLDVCAELIKAVRDVSYDDA